MSDDSIFTDSRSRLWANFRPTNSFESVLVSKLTLRTWGPPTLKVLDANTGLYLLQIDDSLRAIIRESEGQGPEVLDLVLHETLQTFAEAAGR